jgi:hypothetical protein
MKRRFLLSALVFALVSAATQRLLNTGCVYPLSFGAEDDFAAVIQQMEKMARLKGAYEDTSTGPIKIRSAWDSKKTDEMSEAIRPC